MGGGHTTSSHHADSREISRAHHVIDHGTSDGCRGCGASWAARLTTFRLMAEETADRVAASLGVEAPCRTAVSPCRHRRGHLLLAGWRLAAVEADGGGDADLVCECEIVTNAALRHALDERADSSLDDLRRTTRLGMGPCQGAFCTCRAAAVLAERYDAGTLPAAAPDPNDSLRGFLQERLRGAAPIAWGTSSWSSGWRPASTGERWPSYSLPPGKGAPHAER